MSADSVPTQPSSAGGCGRIENLPAECPERLRVVVDGTDVEAFQGETVSAVLLALGRRTFRRTSRRNEPRGLFCGMGVCYDCLVTVDGRPNVQACLEPVVEAMRIETQQGDGCWKDER